MTWEGSGQLILRHVHLKIDLVAESLKNIWSQNH